VFLCSENKTTLQNIWRTRFESAL